MKPETCSAERALAKIPYIIPATQISASTRSAEHACDAVILGESSPSLKNLLYTKSIPVLLKVTSFYYAQLDLHVVQLLGLRGMQNR